MVDPDKSVATTPRPDKGCGMELTRVPVEDDEAMARWYAVTVAADTHDSPDAPKMTLPEIVATARNDEGIEDQQFWVGEVEGEAAGAYRLRMPLRDNLEHADLRLVVHPAFRGQGHGRTLVEHAVAQVRGLGRSRVLSEVVESGPTGARSAGFARAAGFRRALAEAHRVLDLSSIDRARLSQLEKEAYAAAEGYELVGWTGRVPDELVEDYAALAARMSTDAPMDDLSIEPEVWDADRVRTTDDLLAAQGRTMVATAARHVGTGRLVAYSTTGVTRHDPDNVYQWDTLVRRDHRGHRLGMLVKVANLWRLLEVAPEARTLHTWNAESNAHMIAINEAMGFTVLKRQAEWQLDLV